MSTPHCWTTTKDSHLLALRAGGTPWHNIARELKVGRNAAIERARRLGVQPARRTPVSPQPITIRLDRPPLPPGHPVTWRAITDGTPLDGATYPYPVYL